MKITEDVRKYAAEHVTRTIQQSKTWLQEKAAESSTAELN